MIRHLVEHDHLPDYFVEFDSEGDVVVFRNRGTMSQHEPLLEAGSLDPSTYHDARLLAPGWDVHELEREWRDWMSEPPRDPDKAFLGFCRKWHERRGQPS